MPLSSPSCAPLSRILLRRLSSSMSSPPMHKRHPYCVFHLTRHSQPVLYATLFLIVSSLHSLRVSSPLRMTYSFMVLASARSIDFPKKAWQYRSRGNSAGRSVFITLCRYDTVSRSHWTVHRRMPKSVPRCLGRRRTE